MNSLISKKPVTKTNISPVKLYRSPPTDLSTLYTSLCLCQKIGTIVIGSDHKTVITLDLDLYIRAVLLSLK